MHIMISCQVKYSSKHVKFTSHPCHDTIHAHNDFKIIHLCYASISIDKQDVKHETYKTSNNPRLIKTMQG